MTSHATIVRPLDSLLELVRCPCCMSRLTLSHGASPLPRVGPGAQSAWGGGEGSLHCAGCGRSYPLHTVGDGLLEIPLLMRDDDLATLDQDIVVSRSDPESARLDYRRHIAWAERRERFLAPLVHHATSSPSMIPARQGVSGVPAAEAMALFDRFVRDLPADGAVLDLGCGAGAWTARLAGRGPRVVGADTSLTRLEHAAATLAAAGHAALFAAADPMELPFAAASLDGVWCDTAFASVRPDRRTVFFRQANRALRPGGLLYLGAMMAPLGAALRRYLLWRYIYRRPVVLGERIERPPRTRTSGWRYHAATTERGLRALCRDHGFRILALSREGSRLLLLARKERGTDA